MSSFENFSAEVQILGIFVYVITQHDTRSGKKHVEDEEKETLQYRCGCELSGKEENSEGNSAPVLCGNDDKITDCCVIKAIVRALLCLATSAASVACSVVGNIRRAF